MKVFLLGAALLLSSPLHAAQLLIDLGSASHTWQTEELLRHPQAQTITIKDDVSYKREMQYRAVPMATLLKGLKAEDHLQAVALDGFAAELSAAPLLERQGAQAWLAVEDPSRPWPALAADKPSAGPFYLVWTDPAAGHISPEQWPFQVARIQRLEPVAQRFPALLPDPQLAATDPINQALPCSRKTAWPATGSTVPAIHSSVRT
ncbi:hypothetical protein PBOI14_22800 [Pseudomonas sp. Boi14]|nr:hypothetical protein PBOI14_22800 [Pseudomonas sp. Boi14]